MMAKKNNNLELVFDCLYHDQNVHISKLIPRAREEYKDLIRDMPTSEKRRLNFITSLLDYCDQDRWAQAKNQLEPAEQEYHRHFVDRISTTPKAGYYEFHSKRLDEYPENPVSRSSNILEKSVDKTSIPVRPVPKQSKVQFRDTATKVNGVNTAEGIADKFGELYQNEWKSAIYELEQLKIYEKRAIGCLFTIVMDAYRVCNIEAENQISKLENAAYAIMMEGTFVDQEMPVRGNRKCLLEYRKGIAEICIERLQESFRRRYLPEIIRTVGVYQHVRTYGPVIKFANQCIAVCWRMVVMDPPIHIQDERYNQGLFNHESYKPYTKNGNAVAYYVWPALLKYKDGPLLSKGTAEGQ